MKKILTRLLLMSALFTPLLFNSVDDVDYARAFGRYDALQKNTLADDPTQYIGYGFNIAGGKMLSNVDALNINAPILDIKNKTLFDNVKVFDASETVYQTNTSSSRTEMARQLSGVFGLDSNSTIAEICTNFNDHFDLTVGVDWTKTQQEEYSYYVIYAKRNPVVLQLDRKEIKNFLDPVFQKQLYSVKDKTSATQLIQTYGTHLLTGYTLGGIFEMTDYFATTSTSYERQATASFNKQVETGIGANKAGADFSFSASYGAEDNNKYAVNNYKCSTFGGHVFPGLTMDQAFKWYEVPLYGAGYVYDIWTRSINDGENLVITDIPQSSKMMPLWDLLPSSTEYANTRKFLIDAYVDLCGGKLEAYRKENRDVFPTDLNNNKVVQNEAQYIEKGINYEYRIDETNSLYSYIDTANAVSPRININPNSMISMDYDLSKMLNHNIKWKLSENAQGVTVLDDISGVFEVSPDQTKGTFDFICFADGIEIFRKQFSITKMFSGGNGTKESPYLISAPKDFDYLAANDTLWGTDTYYKLTNDIYFDDNASTRKSLSPIGNEITAFKGHLDGNYFTIYNPFLETLSNSKHWGLIGVNEGTIENINVASTINDDVRRVLKTIDVEKTRDINTVFNMSTAAIIAGTNGLGGTINNVHIKNSIIDIKLPSNESCRINRDMSVGSIVGYNQGKVKNCSIEDSTVSLIAPETLKPNVGGLIGKSDSTFAIENCYAKKCNIYGEAGIFGVITKHSTYNDVGGLVGLMMKGELNNCYIGGFNGDVKSNTSNRIVSIVKGIDKFTVGWGGATSRHHPRAGGLIGAAGDENSTEFNINFKNCIIYDCLSTKENGISANLDVKDDPEHDCGYINHGLIYGYGFDGYDYDDKCLNVFIEHTTGSNVSGPFLENIPTTVSNIDCSWSNLPTSITSSKIWQDDGYNRPTLAIKQVDLDVNAFSLNIEDAKRVFFVGDDYTPGNIHLYASYNDGSASFEVKEFVIDSSNFNSTIAGTYKIKVFAYGVELPAFDVQVINASITQMVITKDPVKTSYFEGEKFDPTGMKATIYKNDGSCKEIDINESNISTTTSTLVKGVNNVGITVDNFSIAYKVLAKVRGVVSIEVTKEPTIKEYIVGVNTLSLDGLEVTAHYENGTSKVISNEQLEVINPTINYGENTIIVCYGVYKSASFIVTGKVDINNPVVSKFFEAVEAAESAATLFDKKTTLKAALEAQNALGELESKEINTYKTRLKACLDNFEAIVGGVNNDFKANIKITSSISFGALISGGFDAATLILIAIIKLF